MHESVERLIGWSQSEIALYNQTNRLRTVLDSSMVPFGLSISEYICLSVIHRSHHLTGSAVSREFSIWSILLLFIIYSFLNLNWVIRIWVSIFSVCGPYLSYEFFSILLYYYLADLLEISIYLKGFLVWPLVGTEKVMSSPLTPNWYTKSLILLLYPFSHFTNSYLLISIWKLKSYD
jgi:hypothetical protein